MSDPEPTERFEAAAQRIVEALVPLLHDEDDLVRLGAAESLGEYHLDRSVVALRDFVGRERDEAARGYGLSSLGLVGDESDVAVFLPYLKRPIGDVAGVHALRGLFDLVLRIVVERLEAGLTSSKHDAVRTSAAYMLAAVVRAPRCEEVVAAIRRQIPRELHRGTRGFMEDALRELDGQCRRDDSGTAE